jgi:CRP/FNR family transcriptional regulator, cyclic AMP receptor protein
MAISEELAVDLYKKYGKEFKEGDLLFKEGDFAEEMYIIVGGQIRIIKNLGIPEKETSIAILGEGEIIGEMAIINSEPRSASAIIHETARILVIDKNTFYAMIRNNAEFAMKFLSILSDRLREANVRGSIDVKPLDTKIQMIQVLVSLAKADPNHSLSISQLIDEMKKLGDGMKPSVVEHFIDSLVESRIARREATDLYIINLPELAKLATFLELA